MRGNRDPVLARPDAAPKELLRLVERICASRHLSRSHRLQSFLEFVCAETLEGNAEAICEQVVGYRVFGRAQDYDPASDNIVRVEARDLRKRLESYFAEEGASEPIVLRIPKGGYAPVFEPAANAHPGVGRRRWLIAGLAVLSLALASLFLYPGLRPKATPAAQQTPRVPLFEAFWAKAFDPRQPTLVAVSDSSLSLLQDIEGESVSLEDYSSGRYLARFRDSEKDDEAGRILSRIASRQFTGFGDAVALASLLALNRNHSPTVIRFPRDLSARDLKSGNAIMIGSSRSNPWLYLLYKHLRFHIEYDTKLNLPFLRDSSPEEGRPSIYMGGAPGEKPYDAYGIAASVPNLDGTGRVILAVGTNMQGTEAAGEFLRNAESLEVFLGKIGWRADGPLPVFEVVVKLVTMGSSPMSTEVFAYYVPEN